MTRIRPLRLIAAVVAMLLLGSILTPFSAEADTSTTAVAVATSPTSVRVTWVPTTTPTTSWVVQAVRTSDGSVVGRQTVCGTCLTARFDYLAPRSTYQFTIVGVAAPGSSVWAGASATTPADPRCGGFASCVAVDTTTSAGAPTGVGLGLLRGLTTRTNASRVAALKLNYHRIGAWEQAPFEAARAAGGEIDAVLSDAWGRFTVQQRGVYMNPWEDWELYRSFVTGVVYWHIAKGLVPQYWEIQNEPDEVAWYRTSTPGAAPTQALILQQFQVAHDAIRAMIPDAKIVGPSLGRFDPMTGAVIDMPSFLDFVAANGLRFDVIAWHEMGGDCGGSCDGGPRGIAQHLTTLRDWLAARPSLGQPAIHINEYGAPATVSNPGYAVGYFAALAWSGVTKAGSSCWLATYSGKSYDGCSYEPGVMDHLLMPDGSTPTAAYWVWQAYAQMTGQRLDATASVGDASVYATRSTAGAIDVLVGRHSASTSATSVRVRLTVPLAVRKVNVTTTTILKVNGASTPVTTTRAVSASTGIVDLGALSVASGTALRFQVVGADSRSVAALKDAGTISSAIGTVTRTVGKVRGR